VMRVNGVGETPCAKSRVSGGFRGCARGQSIGTQADFGGFVGSDSCLDVPPGNQTAGWDRELLRELQKGANQSMHIYGSDGLAIWKWVQY
jgi:hypothetical protein